MEINGPTDWRLRHRRSSSTDRFLGVSLENPSPDGDELDEDDVFWTGDFAESSHRNGGDGGFSAATRRRHNPLLHHPRGFGSPEAFGILAALPEEETAPSVRKSSLFFQKSSISSSPAVASASRAIPAVPRPPQERIALPSSVPYHQSAPVNVPVMARMRKKHRDFDELSDEEDGDHGDGSGGEMLPPHKMVARSSAQSPMLACSVLEGVGRTLKGRDLRQVRNAVFRQTAVVKFWLNQFPDRRDALSYWKNQGIRLLDRRHDGEGESVSAEVIAKTDCVIPLKFKLVEFRRSK